MGIDYLGYITSAHRDKPKYMQTIAASAGLFSQIQDVLLGFIDAHYIDNAVGHQLDTLGEWIGQSRYVKRPLDDVYFTWDKSVATGWDSGIWWDKYSPMEGMISLDDDSYRYVLKMFIAANRWQGMTHQAYEIWAQSFGVDNFVLITDYGNMSIDIGFSGKIPASVKALLRAGINPFKPESVRVNTYFTNNADGPMFAWDIANEALNGYDLGNWAERIGA